MDANITILAERRIPGARKPVRVITYELTRRDGTRHTHVREVYDKGDGATLLPYDAARGTVLLTRQMRVPAVLGGHEGPLVEAIAGTLEEGEAPEPSIVREAMEEAGLRVRDLQLVCTAFTSPGVLNEKLSFYVAPYTPADRVARGGGLPEEGEDIEVVELSLAEALAMVGRGDIRDAKTILLLQHVQLAGLMG